MHIVATRLVACFQAAPLLVWCLAMLTAEARMGSGTELGLKKRQEASRLRWTAGARQMQGGHFSLDSLLRGADLQSERIGNTKELIEFIRSLKSNATPTQSNTTSIEVSDSFKSVKKHNVDNKLNAPATEPAPTIIRLKDRDSPPQPEPEPSKPSLAPLPARATKAKGKTKTKNKHRGKSQLGARDKAIKSKAPVVAKAKGRDGIQISRARNGAFGCRCSNGAHLDRVFPGEQVASRYGEAQKKSDWVPGPEPKELGPVVSEQQAEATEDGAEADESEPMVSATELVDKLLAKFDLVEKLVAKLQAIKGANSTATSEARGEDPDSSYGFDLSESELNEPSDQDETGAGLGSLPQRVTRGFYLQQ